MIKVRDYTQRATNGHIYTPVPDWGWILAVVAGVLWLIIAGISACALPFPLLHAVACLHAVVFCLIALEQLLSIQQVKTQGDSERQSHAHHPRHHRGCAAWQAWV